MPIVVSNPGSSPAVWTYTQNPGELVLDAVRWLCQDTDINDQLLLDSEITFAISQEENIYLAAALCCDVIAAHFSRLASSESNGDVSRSYGDRGSEYSQRAATLRERAARGGHAPMAYAGGLTQSDMDLLALDNDAVQPYFRSGMDDHRGESVGSGYGIDQIG